MKFKSIEFKNFKSFKEQHKFVFENKPIGLHFITGDNISEPELGANGAGKSTIFDALHWAIYGRTLRSLKASNVCNWSTKGGCAVKLKLEHHNTAYTILRSWNPNNLWLNNTIVEQKVIDELIGINSEAFQNSIVIGQFSQMFFDMQPSMKLNMFSEILELDEWLEYSKKASNISHDYENLIQDKEVEAATIEGSIDSIKDNVKDYNNKSDKFNNDQKIKTKDMQRELKSCRSEYQESQDNKRNTEHEIKGIKIVLTSIEDTLEELNKINTNKDDEVQKAYRNHEDIFLDTQHTKHEIKVMTNFSGVCNYCKQDVSEAVKTKLITYMRTKLEGLETERIKAFDTYRVLSKELSNINEQVHAAREEYKDYEITLDDVLSNFDSVVANSRDLLAEIKYKKEALAKEIEVENPYEQLLKEANKKLDEFKQTKKFIEKEKNILQKDLTATRFWVKGFKEIRLFIIEEALTALEMEVNNNLIELGLNGWNIKFDVERETKSGTISKGFQILINSPHNKGPVPWEAWSGGELQRLRLAGTLGFANLILNHKGIESNIQVFDEPSQFLSEKGIQDLVELLYNKARNTNKQIWLIDHRSIDFGGFASTTTIVKDDQGSRVL